jgi:hypothetical protein
MSVTTSMSTLPGVGSPLRLAPVTNLERIYALDERRSCARSRGAAVPAEECTDKGVPGSEVLRLALAPTIGAVHRRQCVRTRFAR